MRVCNSIKEILGYAQATSFSVLQMLMYSYVYSPVL